MSKQNSRWSTKESILNTLIVLILLLQCIGNALSMELYFMDHEVTEKKAQIAVREAFNRTQKREFSLINWKFGINSLKRILPCRGETQLVW